MAFVHVETEAILKGKIRKEFAWNIISDYSRYPKIMENVDNVEILERSGNEGKSEWFVTIEEAPLTWIEKDYFNLDNFEIRFESIDGDFDNLNGYWKVEDLGGDGIKLSFGIDYNLGIPVIEEVLGSILKDKMKKNIDSMIHAIKEELTKSQIEERGHNRIHVGKYINLLINEQSVRAYVVNISKKGMLFYYDGDFDALELRICMAGLNIEAEELFNDVKHKNSRVIFKVSLNDGEFKNLLDWFNIQSARTYDRELIEALIPCEMGGQKMDVYIINFSRKGMLIKNIDNAFKMSESVSVLGESILIEDIKWNMISNTTRIIFSQPLTAVSFQELIRKIKTFEVAGAN